MAWAPDYCTAAELKSYVRIADDLDDSQVALAVSAASRAVDRYCNRQFGQAASPVARHYTAHWDPRACRWKVEIDDLMTETGLAVVLDSTGEGDYTETIDTWVLGPRNAAADGLPWTRLTIADGSTYEHGVRVTAQWGWTSVPASVKQATLLQASRILARRNAPFGIAGSPETGSEIRLLAKLDPDVETTLAGYKRWWGAL